MKRKLQKLTPKKIFAVILIILVMLPALYGAKLLVIGPRYTNKSPLLNEQQIYYCFHKYDYVGSAMNIKSGIPIRYGLFEHIYLAEDKKGCIISAQLHERNLFKREDLIEKSNAHSNSD